eukprot:271072-Rhodomonas_salina.1
MALVSNGERIPNAAIGGISPSGSTLELISHEMVLWFRLPTSHLLGIQGSSQRAGMGTKGFGPWPSLPKETASVRMQWTCRNLCCRECQLCSPQKGSKLDVSVRARHLSWIWWQITLSMRDFA